PGQARVTNADLQLYSTTIQGDGLVHAVQTDLTIHMTSSNLKDLAFVYSGANGTGSFDGVVQGKIDRPVLDGDFVLQDHLLSQLKVQKASGGVRLDTAAEYVTLRDVHVTQGQSQVVISGGTAFSGAHANLQVDANRVTADDLKVFVNRNFTGTFS